MKAILNLMVLTGPVWPEGAPPFARAGNLVFLVASLAFFQLPAASAPRWAAL